MTCSNPSISLGRVIDSRKRATHSRRNAATSMGCQPSAKSGGKSSFHTTAIADADLPVLAVPRLGGHAGDLAPSFRRKRLRSRLSSLASSQAPKRHGRRVFRLLLFVAISRFARGDVHDMLGELVRIAGAFA